jgi:hypothetical protein
MAGAGVGVGGREVGSRVAVGRESPWDLTGVAADVGVSVGSGVAVAGVGGRRSVVGVAVGVGVLKRTSLTGVGSRLGSDWAEK